MSKLERQALDGRYVIESKLVALLDRLFRAGNYAWEADENFYVLSVPRFLTLEEQGAIR